MLVKSGGSLGQAAFYSGMLGQLAGLRERRRSTGGTVALVLAGPLLVLLTLLALGPLDGVFSTSGLALVLLADLVYMLLVAGLVAVRVARLVAARRKESAGSRLHLRLTTLFAAIAMVPTITVAVFAAITLNVGLEGWFSDRVQRVVGNSLAAAEAYQFEQERDLRADAQDLADYLDAARRVFPMLGEGELRNLLSEAQARVQRGLRVAFVIDGSGEIRARGERSYRFNYVPPSAGDIGAARDGVVLIRDWPLNEFRALVPLDEYFDRYLYVSRAVDGEILALLDDTRETVAFYQQLEQDRGQILFQFGALYLGFALILILAAVWMGLNFAERLARPVGRLVEAAEQVGAGDLDVQVRVMRDDDEVALLGRVFNQMTRQLKGQRERLLESNRQIDARRRLFDSVLGSVTAGVIGLDSEGRLAFINRAAETLLDVTSDPSESPDLSEIAPEFVPLIERLRVAPPGQDRVQEELRLVRSGRLETVLVRFAERRRSDGRLEGYVVAFDDVSELVSAQRMAAWGDVARRIAHEIKNPLTPIQLSAERIKRKFHSQVGHDADKLEQMTDVIVRQTNDLRRIVDEFSKFARMPEPELHINDMTQLVHDALSLQIAGQPDVHFAAEIPEEQVLVDMDDTMIGQALTNLLKNAGEATETYISRLGAEGYRPEIQLRMSKDKDTVTIKISDNGIGLPEDRARLFEPYVTTRGEGTGLGLPIVKKIIEEHGGTLTLTDAEVFAGYDHAGACAIIQLPASVQAARAPKIPA